MVTKIAQVICDTEKIGKHIELKLLEGSSETLNERMTSVLNDNERCKLIAASSNFSLK